MDALQYADNPDPSLRKHNGSAAYTWSSVTKDCEGRSNARASLPYLPMFGALVLYAESKFAYRPGAHALESPLLRSKIQDIVTQAISRL